jgi:disulfide bond formation protein DsbB
MQKSLRLLNGLVGFALIIAAFFIEEIPLIHVEQSPSSDAFRLVQFHLLLSGVVSLLVARSSQNSQIGTSSLLMLVFVNLWIGGAAIFAKDPKVLWVLVFPVSSIINFVQLLAQDSPTWANEKTDAGEPEVDSGEADLISEKFAMVKAPRSGALLRTVLWMTIILPLMIIIPVILLVYGNILKRVIVEGGNLDFSRIGPALQAMGQKLAPIILILVIVYSLVFIVQFIFQRIAAQGGEAENSDVNRNLSDQEQSYIQRSLDALENYISNKEFGVFPRFALVIFYILPVGLLILFPAASVLLEVESFKWLLEKRAGGFEIIAKAGPAFAGTILPMASFGVGIGWASIQYMGAKSQILAEYLHAKAGWNSLNSRERTIGEYALILGRFVRLRRYEIDKPFDPAQFLYATFREFEGLVYKTTAVLGGAAIFFTVADIGWYQLLQPQGVRYSSYLSLDSKVAPLSALDRVELRCFRFGEEGDEEAKLGLGYRLIKKGEFSMEVLLHEDKTPDYLDQLEALDADIRAAGVSMVRAKRAGIWWPGKSGFKADCKQDVDQEFDTGIAVRLNRLLSGP